MNTATAIRLRESALDPAAAVYDHTVPAGEPYLLEIAKGQTQRLADLDGTHIALAEPHRFLAV